MNRTARYVLRGAALAVLAAACTTLQPPRSESQADPNANIPAYRSYGWETPSGPNADAPLRLIDTHIRNAISQELGRRGYAESVENPDFRVGYETVAYEKVKTNPFRIGIGMGSWGGNTGGSVGVGTSGVESFEEGRLVIHVYDAKTNKEVWLGTSTGRLPQHGHDQESVTKAVALTIQEFPTRAPMP
jgi:Domain of unknown function (DUF4136)